MKKRFIAEFEKQSFTQIIFPHANTDWAPYLDEAQKNFVNIVNEIVKYQKCLVVSYDIQSVKKHFQDNDNLYFAEYISDDTWARDCSALSISESNKTKLLDFTFNAWGNKFEASKDDLMSRSISNHYSSELETINFSLEGGAVESNGNGILLTTSACMLNENRNPELEDAQITQRLKDYFGSSEILYLDHGYLSGDDTDSHVDTLARFVDEKTIMYVKCEDTNDEHYQELKLMEEELQELASTHNFKLISLPMTDAVYYEDERLPATYANFLFVNGAVLVPTYGVRQDEVALDIFRATFEDRDVIGIDCSTLIRQHGSLHCVTMNFASDIALN
ncbi:peptidyl-arginine deiminase [Sulfurimonas gotlandica GD1]|jgi:agmatine deiminase|uniref:Peptidyl-arginine deiminase n=1 Tax=Sulfurimonas gotlandica (strain DSM 19862 / JCM 16533 / GD1) TaxID=929558 RepID=B6BM31_SULGG|nr:agmatine deiminase family protein [Sulfurimonas gotlandica]EDZ61849.1 porphyromonas-type peptidyl-arginine deiminase [Sulfurimonas gotlandica GD1]EHP29393.1 peptidyl-arginine deiminase [Sulfurimonas gotlandica GD1]